MGEHTHLMARLKQAAAGGEGTYNTAEFIRLWVPEVAGGDEQLLLCRLDPPPVYDILCSDCSALDRASERENGRLLCSLCRGACAWCGRSAINGPRTKRSLYCADCWDDSDTSTKYSRKGSKSECS